MRSRISLAVQALGLTLAVSAFAQTLPPGVQKKASQGGIAEYAFPNGLRVLLYPNPANPKITVNVTYLVGSRHEGYGESGMAHLLEHMNFIETTNGGKSKPRSWAAEPPGTAPLPPTVQIITKRFPPPTKI